MVPLKENYSLEWAWPSKELLPYLHCSPHLWIWSVYISAVINILVGTNQVTSAVWHGLVGFPTSKYEGYLGHIYQSPVGDGGWNHFRGPSVGWTLNFFSWNCDIKVFGPIASSQGHTLCHAQRYRPLTCDWWTVLVTAFLSKGNPTFLRVVALEQVPAVVALLNQPVKRAGLHSSNFLNL